MTHDEQMQLDHLRAQLESANKSAEDTRHYFASALGRSTNETRLYCGLFWCLLALAAVVTIVTIVQR
jgi:hypothetical protein